MSASHCSVKQGHIYFYFLTVTTYFINVWETCQEEPVSELLMTELVCSSFSFCLLCVVLYV